MCRDDRKEEIRDWQLFFQRIGVPIFGILVSKLSGTGGVKKKEIIEASVIGLSRKPVMDKVIISLAGLIKQELSL